MTNTYYVVKINDRYMTRLVDMGEKVRVATEDTIENALLLNLPMRNKFITKMVQGLKMGDNKITCEKVDVESCIDESAEEFGIQFESNKQYIVDIHPDGIVTSAPDLMDCARLFSKGKAETLRLLLMGMEQDDVVPDNLKGGIKIVPIKKTFTNIQTI